MARKSLIKVRRGVEAQLKNGILDDCEFGFTTDSKKLYIGLGGINYCLGSSNLLGDMNKSIYDTNNDGIIDKAKTVVGPVTWNQLRGV